VHDDLRTDYENCVLGSQEYFDRKRRWCELHADLLHRLTQNAESKFDIASLKRNRGRTSVTYYVSEPENAYENEGDELGNFVVICSKAECDEYSNQEFRMLYAECYLTAEEREERDVWFQEPEIFHDFEKTRPFAFVWGKEIQELGYRLMHTRKELDIEWRIYQCCANRRETIDPLKVEKSQGNLVDKATQIDKVDTSAMVKELFTKPLNLSQDTTSGKAVNQPKIFEEFHSTDASTKSIQEKSDQNKTVTDESTKTKASTDPTYSDQSACDSETVKTELKKPKTSFEETGPFKKYVEKLRKNFYPEKESQTFRQWYDTLRTSTTGKLLPKDVFSNLQARRWFIRRFLKDVWKQFRLEFSTGPYVTSINLPDSETVNLRLNTLLKRKEVQLNDAWNAISAHKKEIFQLKRDKLKYEAEIAEKNVFLQELLNGDEHDDDLLAGDWGDDDVIPDQDCQASKSDEVNYRTPENVPDQTHESNPHQIIAKPTIMETTQELIAIQRNLTSEMKMVVKSDQD